MIRYIKPGKVLIMKKKYNFFIFFILFLSFSLLIVIFIRFNFFSKNPSISLTNEELDWIKKHPVISIGLDPEYAPFEFYENGKYSGLSMDYLNWIESQINIDIKPVLFETWDELLQSAYDKEIDMTGAIVKTDARMEHLLFTEPFYNNFDTILTSKEMKSIKEEDLVHYKTGVIKDYSVAQFLKEKYPNMNLVEVTNVTEGLKLLSFGELEAFVTDFSQASYYIQKYGYQNIYALETSRISTDGHLRFGIRKDYTLLVSILNKALVAMPSDFKSDAQSKWIGVKITPLITETVLTVFIVIMLLLLIVAAVVIVINRLLKKEVDDKTGVIRQELTHIKTIESELLVLNETLEQKVRERTSELEKVIKDLHETQEQMIQSEKMASLGGLVAGVAHEINTPLGITLTASTYLQRINADLQEKFLLGNIKKSEFENYMQAVSSSTEIINDNLKRAAELVQSFKQLAVDQSSDSRRKFSLKENCEVVIVTLQHEYDPKKIQILNQIDEYTIIDSYPSAFSQIFTQLILNSIQHAFVDGKEGTIQIYSESFANEIKILFLDDGIGLDDYLLQHIFDPFFTTKRHLGNSGLGMHIVYNIVTQKLKGNITVTSLEKGISYEITLPQS